MKTREKTIRGYMNFLGFLYITLEEKTEFNMNDACLIHSVNKQIPTLLKNRGILLNENRGYWKWNYDYKPNPKMIESLLKELSNINNLQNKKRRKMEVKLTRLQVQNNSLTDKTNGFLNELYDTLTKGKNVNITDLHKKHNTPTRLTVALQNLGIIHNYSNSRKDSDWGWISSKKPSKFMVEKAIEEKRRLDREKVNKMRAKKMPKRIVETEVKKPTRGGKREGAGRKSKAVEMACKTETKKISLFWGLFNYELKK
jgi:hypothetical protein